MKNLRNTILVCFLLGVASNTSAQSDSTTFVPSGRVIARAFADYSTGLNGATNQSGFDLTRALLGYNYRISPTLQAQVVIDGASGQTANGSLEVYVRNAFINWSDHGFSISAGEIGMLEFAVQEDYWHHRYVLKSFQDLNKMSASVDVGITGEYTVNKYLSLDATIVNGEGYKKVKKDDSNRYGLGITAHPTDHIVLRAFGDIYNESEALRGTLPTGVTDAKYKDQYSMALFAGYRDKKISGGMEYNHFYNKGFVADKDYFGYSAYVSALVAPKWRAYLRYDNMDSSAPDSFAQPWNELDGQLMIGGIEYQPVKQLKISPNFRNINPSRGTSEQYVFVNLEFNL